VTPGAPAWPALTVVQPSGSGGGERWWRRPRAVRTARGGGEGVAASPSGGLMGAAAAMLGFWFVRWGVADEVRRCVEAAVV
jgi:hypothetical protein